MGLLLKVVVHVATIQDREGVKLLLLPLKGVFPRMKKVWLDVGYSGKGRKWEREKERDGLEPLEDYSGSIGVLVRLPNWLLA